MIQLFEVGLSNFRNKKRGRLYRQIRLVKPSLSISKYKIEEIQDARTQYMPLYR